MMYSVPELQNVGWRVCLWGVFRLRFCFCPPEEGSAHRSDPTCLRRGVNVLGSLEKHSWILVAFGVRHDAARPVCLLLNVRSHSKEAIIND